MRPLEFRDIGLGDLLLGVARDKNLGSVPGAFIGALPVKLCWVMRHREIDLQQAAE
jgi:hypothetical protein